MLKGNSSSLLKLQGYLLKGRPVLQETRAHLYLELALTLGSCNQARGLHLSIGYGERNSRDFRGQQKSELKLLGMIKMVLQFIHLSETRRNTSDHVDNNSLYHQLGALVAE
ncbi:hypothetical protein V6N13_119129 [Hibiscus sabdariffa]|uniref:Uncharacterized protein n=1 Tax=Hibiscus sabdariffa TaxID=183260 RepID=A0ABR2E3U0_9ROSI